MMLIAMLGGSCSASVDNEIRFVTMSSDVDDEAIRGLVRWCGAM